MNIPEYRAWHKKTKKMYRVKGWMQGDYGPQDIAVYCVDEHGVTERFADGLVELMQSLPFPTRNDKPVYEGDIVAARLGTEYVKSVVRIGESETDGSDNCWPESYYGVYLEGSSGLLDYLLQGKMYVVGNVWESKEEDGQALT